MRLIIAGGRNFDDYFLLEQEVLLFLKDLEQPLFGVTIVSGGAKGADQLGEQFAKDNNLVVIQYLANWNLYGKSSGYKRNVRMAENADACICFWDGESKGTQHMINIAREHHLSLKIVTYM
jgi:hypothetical protein